MMIDRQAIPNTRIVRKKTNTDQTAIAPSLKNALSRHAQDSKSRLQTLMDLKNSSGWLFSDKVLLIEGKTERRVLPTLFWCLTGRSLAEEKFALVELDGVAAMAQCMNILNDLGIPAYGLADFDYALNDAVKAGYIQEDDQDLQDCLCQIKSMSQNDTNIKIGDNGRPCKGKGCKKPHQVISEWASKEEASVTAKALHDKLRGYNIWLWPGGDIEVHLGLSSKDEQTWSDFKEALENGNWQEAVEDMGTISSFVNWLR